METILERDVEKLLSPFLFILVSTLSRFDEVCEFNHILRVINSIDILVLVKKIHHLHQILFVINNILISRIIDD